MRACTGKLLPILTEIQPSTTEFVDKLDKFFANRQGILALKAEVAQPGELESVKMEVVGIVDEATGRYKLQYFQRALDGTTPIQTAKDLYDVAEKVLPEFKLMMDAIEAEAGQGVEAKVAPLKQEDRALKKAVDDYAERETDGGGPAIGWVFVRCSVFAIGTNCSFARGC